MNWHPCPECGKSHPFKVTAARPCPNSSREAVQSVASSPDYNGVKSPALVSAPVLSGEKMHGSGKKVPAREAKPSGHSSTVERQPSTLKMTGSNPAGRSKSKARSSAVKQRTLTPPVDSSNLSAAAKKSKYRDLEKRKAYMREYMKKRRAKLAVVKATA